MRAGFTATTEPLASVYDVALLDLDGVVYVGPDAVPHAARSLDDARALHGMRAAFVTNNAARPPAVVAEHLRALGVRATDADVVTSAQAGARMLAQQLVPGSAVLAVGGPGVGAALVQRGLVPVSSADDDPVAVLQGYGPDVGWRQLAEASLVIERGLPWVATNLDATIPTPRGRVLGNGAMVAALRAATGVEPLVAGKPEPPLMLESVERTGAQTPLVVGDRLDTDIEGATRTGIASLLVLTGVTHWPDLFGVGAPHRPTYLDHDLRGLLEAQPEVGVHQEGDLLIGTCRGIQIRVPVAPVAVGPTPTSGVGGAAQVDPAWWLLTDDRPAPGARAADLDVVRAAVGVAWYAADAALTVRGSASVLQAQP